MKIWGHRSKRHEAGPPPDRVVPMPVPNRSASPLPYYAPSGPGPLPAPGMAVSMPPYEVQAPATEHRHHKHHRRHKHRHHDPQVIVKHEAPPVIPQVINQEPPKPILLNPGFMNPDLLIPGQHHSTHEHTRRADHKRSHTVSHSHSHGHGHGRSQNHVQSHDQGPGQGPSRHHGHGHSRSHSHTPRPRRSSSFHRPFFTSMAHVQPFPVPSPTPSEHPPEQERNPLPQMPPSPPIRSRANSLPGKQHPMFQYSKCNGRKRALCIGINYRGQQNELRGCINDAKNVSQYLMKYWGYKSGDIVVLTDDARDHRQLPTRKNIIDAMRWLVRDAHCHDALFFHYSGHGGQTKDLNGDEIDGYDEVIFPLDFSRAGHILDDDMNTIMVRPLPQGCRLTAVFDSCHSGTALDLPYVYHSNGRLRGGQISSSARAAKATHADVISWCACRDDQTSADTTEGGEAVGAMSYAFMVSLKQNPNQTYAQLLRSVREILRKRYSQKSQLSSSHPIDTNIRFLM